MDTNIPQLPTFDESLAKLKYKSEPEHARRQACTCLMMRDPKTASEWCLKDPGALRREAKDARDGHRAMVVYKSEQLRGEGLHRVVDSREKLRTPVLRQPSNVADGPVPCVGHRLFRRVLPELDFRPGR